MQIPTGALSSKQGLSKKLIVGFTALAAAAVVSTVGMASAANQMPNQTVGYGGDAHVNTNVSVDAEVNGNNNIVHIVVQPIYNFFSNLNN